MICPNCGNEMFIDEWSGWRGQGSHKRRDQGVGKQGWLSQLTAEIKK